MRTRIRWALLGLGLVSPLGCVGRGEKTVEADTSPKPVQIKVGEVVRRPVERTVAAVGTLKGWEEVTVGSKRSGRVLKVLHDLGDPVKPGEPMIEMETVDARLAVRQAEKKLLADLAKLGLESVPEKGYDFTTVPSVVQARIAQEKAQQEFARQLSLQQRHAGTPQEFQNSQKDLKGAEAALENAILTARSTLATALASQVALEVAQQALSDTVVLAPVPSSQPPGLSQAMTYAVARRLVSEGQILKEGEAVAELVVINPLRLWANVPERFVSDVQIGQPVRITVAAYSESDRVFEGKVARINPRVDPVSRTFQVEASVPNDKGLLHPGGFAKASIVTNRESEATVVPIEAVARFAGVTKLFIVRNEKAHEIKVETELEDPKGDWIEVIGLTERVPVPAQVVIEGQMALADGTPVVIKKNDQPADRSLGAEPAIKTAASSKPGNEH